MKMVFTALVGPYWEKLCPRSEYRPKPYSRPQAQFLPSPNMDRTSQPVNNIYMFQKTPVCIRHVRLITIKGKYAYIHNI